MPGPNVLDLVGDIRESVERLPKDQLVDILVYVFKEYVVEGPAPLAAAPAAFADDLAGMSFAEVVRSLQLRLDLPELELFDVQGDRVTVRLQGRPLPIEVPRAEPGPAPQPIAPPAPAARVPAATQQPSAAAPQQTNVATQQSPVAAQQPRAATQQPAAATQQAPITSGQATSGTQPAAPATKPGGLLEID